MREVYSKGQLSRSMDLTAWLGVAAAAVLLVPAVAAGSAASTDQFASARNAMSHPEPALALRALEHGMASIASTIGPLLIAVSIAVLAGAVVQGGVRPRKFRGRFEQFNLVTGMKRVFGRQALWQGVKALTKTVVVGLALWVVVDTLVPVLAAAGALPVAALLQVAADGVVSLLWAAVVAGLAIAALDVYVVIRRNRKRTRMTKKEVKDEHKRTDGDPLIKSQRRSMQYALSRNRMIAAVGGADVVLVNPTHVAVALRYAPGQSAPTVVAKGAGVVAARIREKAESERVPIVRDVPLTRALHAACEVGQEIPVEFYNAVARVLAFVMSLKARGAATGVHTAAA